jgi:large subunit ribosomal protein L9
MRVILKEDVEHLGARGAIVTVKDGFARNYLLPKGMAMRFTAGAQKVLEQERRMYELRQLKAKEEASALGDKIAVLEFTVHKRSGDQDVLYGSVTPTDIADLLRSAGYVVDKRRILLHEPIKKLGDFEVSIRLHHEVAPKIMLHVLKEE